mmetsp:Transcript_58398/g.134802  ORF Transcript_58398/g.134802 Transcript_58398/m.134802 type:complete len:286 (-) Transcript_58398:1515-2372(-)
MKLNPNILKCVHQTRVLRVVVGRDDVIIENILAARHVNFRKRLELAFTVRIVTQGILRRHLVKRQLRDHLVHRILHSRHLDCLDPIRKVRKQCLCFVCMYHSKLHCLVVREADKEMLQRVEASATLATFHLVMLVVEEQQSLLIQNCIIVHFEREAIDTGSRLDGRDRGGQATACLTGLFGCARKVTLPLENDGLPIIHREIFAVMGILHHDLVVQVRVRWGPQPLHSVHLSRGRLLLLLPTSFVDILTDNLRVKHILTARQVHVSEPVELTKARILLLERKCMR